MNAQEICHLFAAQDYGRNGGRKAGNVFSDDDTRSLYSYGRHFPLATWTGTDALPLLTNSGSYSISTSRHQSEARRALHHIAPQIAVPNPRANHPNEHLANAQSLFAEAAAALQSAARPRISPDTRERKISRAVTRANEAETYRKAFQVPLASLTPLARSHRKTALQFDPANPGPAFEALREADKAERLRRDKEIKAREARDAKARAAWEEEANATRAEWLAGTGNRYPRERYDSPARLRLNGNAVETSHGARVHVRAAARLWPLAQRARRTGTTYSPEPPHKVGPYTLESVSPEGVKIGCHFIAYEEMERLAPQVLAAAATAPAEEETAAA